MGEFASKGVAGAGLGLGIAGTALGLLNSNCGNGLLGGIFGGNCCNGARYGAGVGLGLGAGEVQYVSELQARVQGLEAEKVANANMVAAFNQTVANDKELRAEMYAYIKPLAEEAANNRVHRHRMDGSRAWPAWVIDHLFFWQDEHCKTAYESEIERAHLPPSMRDTNEQ